MDLNVLSLSSRGPHEDRLRGCSSAESCSLYRSRHNAAPLMKQAVLIFFRVPCMAAEFRTDNQNLPDNAVLQNLLSTRTMKVGSELVSLHSEMSIEGGELIRRVFTELKPRCSVEVGLAYGVSTLYACSAMGVCRDGWKHIAIDPCQARDWNGLGIENVRLAGFDANLVLIEEGSETALPSLLRAGLKVQAAIIDGWHTFDHTLIDFFYVNRLLEVGGVIVLDDADWPAIARVCSHVSTYPAYKRFEVPVYRTLRQRLSTKPGLSLLRRAGDKERVVAFQKVTEDTRAWDWYAPF